MRSWLIRLGSGIRRHLSRLRKTGKPPHREIAVVGPHERDCASLVQLLFQDDGQLRRGGVGSRRPLRIAKVVSHQLGRDASAPSVNGTYEGMFLPPGARRHRWWTVHVPGWDEQQKAPIEGGWLERSDTLLVCIPHSQIASEGLRAEDLDFHIPVTVGHARSRGRLRRTGIVVMGVPAEIAPRHPSQVRCDVPWRRDLAPGLEELLGSRAGLHGDGFADPGWRNFLEGQVAPNAELAELFETIRRAAGRNCPLFFIGGGDASHQARVPLLEWIGGSHSASTSSTRPVAAAVCLPLALLLLASLGLAARLPTTSDPADRAQLLAGPSRELEAALDVAIAGYSRLAPRVVAPGIGRSRSREELSRARDAVRRHAGLIDRAAQGASSARDRFAELLALVGEGGVEERAALLVWLRGHLVEQLELRASWRAEAEAVGLDPQAALAWDVGLERLIVLATLVPMQLAGQDLGHVVLPDDVVEEMSLHLSALGRSERAAELRVLAARSAPEEFYAELARQERGAADSGDATLRQVAAVLPQPDAEAYVGALEAESLAELAARSATLREDVDALEVLAGIRLGEELLVDPALAARARALVERMDEALTSREMIVEFLRPRDGRWHLDIRLEGRRAWAPTSIPNDEHASYFRIPGGRFGQRLTLALHAGNGIHTAPQGERDSTGATVTLVLDRSEGTLRFGDVVVQFKVLSGFPEWQAATSA